MSIASDLIARLRSFLFRRREDRELREELQFHVEMEAEQNQRRGMSASEARRQGVLALGGVERTREDVGDARGTRFAEESAGDAGYAMRLLRRSPGFATVAILTLAIGIGGTTAVYSAVDAVLLQPLPYQQPGQLVRLYQSYSRGGDPRGFVTPVHFLEYRKRVSSFASTAAILTYDATGADIGTGDGARRIRLLMVSGEYFDVLRVHPALGRPLRTEDETGPAVLKEDFGIGAHFVVLSYPLWRDRFHGDPGAIGQSIVMSGTSFTIAGVMPDGFVDPIAGPVDAFVPMDLRAGLDASNADNHFLTAIARRRPGVSLGQAQAEIAVLDKALGVEYPAAVDERGRIFPLKDDIVGPSSRALQILLGAVVLVLVLVCVNIANLLLVRASERSREFSLRAALGAGRGRLIRQLLMESLALAIAGDVAGLLVARLGMSAIVNLGSSAIPRLASLTLEPRMLLFSLAIATVAALGFGLAPALRVGRTQPGDALREAGRGASGGVAQARVRQALVIAQVALAFVLLVGAGLLIASVQRIRQLDLGVQTSGALVFELHLPDARYDSTARARFYDDLAGRVRRLPGVIAAGGISRLPATGSYHTWGVNLLTGPLAHNPGGNGGAENRVVSGDYFAAAGIPLLAGRVFDAHDDATAPERAVVSRSVAEAFFPHVDAVGQRLRTGGRDAEIIGVVGDVAVDAEGRAARYIYHWHAQWAGDRNWALTQVIRARGSLAALQPEIRRTLASMDPALVMWKPMPFADAVGQGVAQRTFTLRILTAFALVAVALAALGLFGVLSYGVRVRSREFGIRMALGADAGVIRRTVITQGLSMAGIGTAIGVLGAVALSRVMAALVFHVSPLDPAVLVGAVVLMGCVAALAAWLPARRATAMQVHDLLG